MRILMLIPQAFYTTRGTPLSAYHRTRELVKLGYQVDVLTYPIGEPPPGLDIKVYRSRGPHFAKKIKQGPSKVKIWFDFLFALTLLGILIRHRRKYTMLYGHEEGGFIAAVFGTVFRLPYVYDMHSSLPMQITEWKFSRSKWVLRIFEWVERFSIRNARITVTIAPAVTEAALRTCPDAPVITILNRFDIDRPAMPEDRARIRNKYGIDEAAKVVLYTGSFVPLQALDLLIEAVPNVLREAPRAHFLLVGGSPEQLAEYSEKLDALGIGESFTLVGARPQTEMPAFMAAADALVSPRVKGINPPGKLFSYLRSGKPVVACDTLVHNQILNDECSILTPPSPEGLSAGIMKALRGEEAVARITRGAAAVIARNYSKEVREQAYRSLIDAMKADGRVAASTPATETDTLS